MNDKQNRNAARWIISVIVFLSGTALSALIVHLIWLAFLSLSVRNDPNSGFGTPLIVVIYFFSIFLIAPFGGLFAAKFWLKRTRI